jgi:hydroxymethylpyrimidine kinase/phosphomethylpyrimidine kinase
MTQPVCLTIAGLDPSGGAGILADVRTFAAFGCFPAAVVTSITFQNTVGVFGAQHQSADAVRRQVEPIIDDYTIAALKTGMLPTLEVIEAMASLIKRMGGAKLVVDPVVRSTSGFDLIDDDALRSLITVMFPLADVVTPNLPEAERIAGFRITSVDDIDRAAAAMQKMGAKNVLIKGGHLAEANIDKAKAIDYLYEGSARHLFSRDHIDTTATHGTGCTLAAAITANLALGKNLADAIAIAKQFVTEAIRTAPMLGHGHSPINIR